MSDNKISLFFSWATHPTILGNENYLNSSGIKLINFIKTYCRYRNIIYINDNNSEDYNNNNNNTIIDNIYENIKKCNIYICDFTPMKIIDKYNNNKKQYCDKSYVINQNVLMEFGYSMSINVFKIFIIRQMENDISLINNYLPYNIRTYTINTLFINNDDIIDNSKTLLVDKLDNYLINTFKTINYDVRYFRDITYKIDKNTSITDLNNFLFNYIFKCNKHIEKDTDNYNKYEQILKQLIKLSHDLKDFYCYNNCNSYKKHLENILVNFEKLSIYL